MNNVNTNNRKETTGNKPTYDHLLPSPPAAFGTQPSALTASGAAFAALPNPAANAVPGLSHLSPQMLQQQQQMYALYQQQQLLFGSPSLNAPATMPMTRPYPDTPLAAYGLSEDDVIIEEVKKPAPVKNPTPVLKKKGKSSKVVAKKTKKKEGSGRPARSKNFQLREQLRLVRAVAKVRPTNNGAFLKRVKPTFNKLREDDEPLIDRNDTSLLNQWNTLTGATPAMRKKKCEKTQGMDKVFKMIDEYELEEATEAHVKTTNPKHPLSILASGSKTTSDGDEVDDAEDSDDEEGGNQKAEDEKRRARLVKLNAERDATRKKKDKIQNTLVSALDSISQALENDSKAATGGGPGMNEQLVILQQQQKQLQQDNNEKFDAIMKALGNRD